MSAWTDGLNGWLGKRVESDAELHTQESSTTRTGGSHDQEPVVVWEAANLMEAQVVKGRLMSEGIPAIVRGESLGTIYGLTAGKLASADVLVPAPLADTARQILDTEVDWSNAEDVFDDSGDDLPKEA